MRLIDADKINFEEVFGGQSDFAKDLRETAQKLIDRQPVSFDKEKVKEELIAGKFITVDRDAIGKSVYIRIDRAVEIVEKGGIK